MLDGSHIGLTLLPAYGEGPAALNTRTDEWFTLVVCSPRGGPSARRANNTYTDEWFTLVCNPRGGAISSQGSQHIH